MARTNLKREKWTLSFDAALKALVVRAARRKGIYPVALLEGLVRERFNPYGHTTIEDSVEYVAHLRKQSRERSEGEFLAELRSWNKISRLRRRVE